MPTDHNIWTGLTYDDPLAARPWLTQRRFREGGCYFADDGTTGVHSEMLGPEGGRVLVHGRCRGDDTFAVNRGAASVYVVVDDVNAGYARATELGATVVREIEDTDYGSCGFSVADAEGNCWSFGPCAGA